MIPATTAHEAGVRRVVLVVMVVTAVLGMRPLPASGCSCAGIENPRAAIVAAAGAFVGVLERIDGDEYEDATFHYRVDHAIKGVTGKTVAIPTRGGGGGCGLEHRPGEHVGLFLGRKSGEWTANLCSSIDPERLLAAARPLPPPDGKGPPAFVVGNSLGDDRTMLLDTQGRTLAYGAGPSPNSGDVIDLALCPGNQRVIEALSGFRDEAAAILSVRLLDGFKLEGEVSRTALPGLAGRTSHVRSVRCRGPGAGGIDVVVDDYRDAGQRTFVFRLENGAWRAVWEDEGMHAQLTDSGQAVLFGTDRIERLDLATGARAPVHRVPDIRSVAPSPDGRLLAVTTAKDYRVDQLLLVDGTTGEQRASQAITSTDEAGDPVWVDARTVAMTEGRTGLVFRDHNLRAVATIVDWRSYRVWATGGRVYGIGFDRRIVEATADRPTRRPWVRLPDGSTFAILALPAARTSPPTEPPLTTTIAAPPTTLPLDRVVAPPFQPAAAGSDRPWAPAAVAMLLLMAVATVARRSVRRSG